MGALKTQEARHLIVRTGLGMHWDDLKHYQGRSKRESIRHIVYNTNNQWVLTTAFFCSATH